MRQRPRDYQDDVQSLEVGVHSRCRYFRFDCWYCLGVDVVMSVPVDPRSKFFTAMKEKMERRAREKNRTMEPWKDYDEMYLSARLVEEYHEWMNVVEHGGVGSDRLYEADELLDIANFCMFRWIQIKEKND